MANTKSERMQVVQVIELLRQGNIEALVNVPQAVIVQATAKIQEAGKLEARQRGLKWTVYPNSGVIGLTGLRVAPFSAYGAEWDTIAEQLQSDEFKAARNDPMASTGPDDPRYAEYREKAKAKRKEAADKARQAG